MIRNIIHYFFLWYLNRVGGAFHVGSYGDRGRYIVIMSEDKYHDFGVTEKREPTIIESFPMHDAYPEEK